MFEECDPELAQSAMPAHLKLLEGLLKNEPHNREILTTLSMGFCGYSLLFIEDEDPERASELYLRGMDYGIRALGQKGLFLKNGKVDKRRLAADLKGVKEADFNAFFWTTVSLNAWLNLNLDKPKAIVRLGLAQACLNRVLELDDSYLYGLPNILMGVSLSARPPMLGGHPEKAKAFFKKALTGSAGKFLFAQYYYARYYAVRVQDKSLFNRLIREIRNSEPRSLKDVCLMNRVMQQKSKALEEAADELFL
jgi:hypothetical protein